MPLTQTLGALADAGRVHARRGFGVVELVIALVIGATLMLALASGVKALSDSYVGNTGRNTAMQSARQAVFKICSVARQALGGKVPNSTSLFLAKSLTTYDVYVLDGKYLRYYPDYAGAPTLPLSSGAPNYVLARDVSSLAFASKIDRAGNLVQVEVRLTVAPKNGSYTLSDSALLRRTRTLPNPLLPVVNTDPAPL